MARYALDPAWHAERERLGSLTRLWKIFVQLSLDSTQAAGRAQKPLLAEWLNDGTGNSIAPVPAP